MLFFKRDNILFLFITLQILRFRHINIKSFNYKYQILSIFIFERSLWLPLLKFFYICMKLNVKKQLSRKNS